MDLDLQKKTKDGMKRKSDVEAEMKMEYRGAEDPSVIVLDSLFEIRRT